MCLCVYIYKCGGGLVTKSCPTLTTSWTVAHQAPLSTRLLLHGISQARLLEWVSISFSYISYTYIGFPSGSVVNNLLAMQEMQVQSQGWENPLEEGMATHSSILARRIPWTKKPVGLQSIVLQRVGHD